MGLKESLVGWLLRGEEEWRWRWGIQLKLEDDEAKGGRLVVEEAATTA